MMNVVVMVGRLVADPPLRQTPQGTSVTSFRIAVDRQYSGKNGQRQADFFDCVAWRQQAEFIAKYFGKGSPIAIHGSLQTRQYQDKNGNNRTATEILVQQVSFCPGSKSASAGGQNTGTAPSSAAYGYAPAGTQQNAAYPPMADDFAPLDPIDEPEDLPF